MFAPFASEGIWLRCALHAHTTNSDGELSPADLVAHYERGGYDVVAVTDHWVSCDQESTSRTLVLPGLELNCVLPETRDGHVLAYGIAPTEEELRELGSEYRNLEETAQWIVGQGGVAYLAHPYWTGIRTGSFELPAAVTGIEVFNAGCELEIGRGNSVVHWDDLLATGRVCPGLASDDTHHPGFDSDFAWTWVKAADRTVEGVLDALRSGSLYGSTGPRVYSVSREADRIEVHCSPVQSVILGAGPSTGAGVRAGRLGYAYRGRILERDDAGLIVGAELEIHPRALHARVEVTDSTGGKAWVNPFTV